MSWYFDTENWAAGMWNSWAESRTDVWRAAMVQAVLADDAGRGRPLPFSIQPPGVDGEFRDGYLNEHWLMSLARAPRSGNEDWRVEYNTERDRVSHRSLGRVGVHNKSGSSIAAVVRAALSL